MLMLLAFLLGARQDTTVDTLLVAPAAPEPVAPAVPVRMDGSPDWSRLLAPQAPAAPIDQEPRRRRAVQYSDGYYKRLAVHRVLSFAMIPLFVGSFVTGNEMINNPDDPAGWAESLHKPFAIGTATVFGVNTVTGVWNLLESRKNPEGRTRRGLHGIGMLVADAGFAYTGAVLSGQAKSDPTRRDDHRNFALASMGVAVANWTFMLLTR